MISPKRGLSPLNVVSLGCQDYEIVLREMRRFTDERDAETGDELWLLEHPPVFTQGQAGKAEHLLDSGNIPVVQSDRGGQITYHGPGQLVAYPLLNLRRLGLGVRELVSIIEKSVVTFLSEYRINSAPKSDAPGVYVEGRKIASLGLRVRKGCSFHGVAINISLDLSPFRQINPCGYAELEMVRLADLTDSIATVDAVKTRYADLLAEALGLQANFSTALPEWSR